MEFDGSRAHDVEAAGEHVCQGIMETYFRQPFQKIDIKDHPFFYSDSGGQHKMISSALQGTPRQQLLAKAHFLWIRGSVSPWFYGPKHGHLRLNVNF